MDYEDFDLSRVVTPCCETSALCRASGKTNALKSSGSPAAQYQRLKRIQNTVRVASSLYAMNLAALSAYETPDDGTQVILNSGSAYVGGGGVNWNQMSDRKVPHVQKVVTANPGKSSTRHTITRLRPGAGSPGGIGVDIKHNSYERYLNRIKAKKPLRRGQVMPNYAHASKNLKTSIVSGCNDCTNKNTELLYQMDCGLLETSTLVQQPVSITKYAVGDFVWVRKCKRTPKRVKAQIISMSADLEQYVVKYADCCSMTKQYADLKPWQACKPDLFAITYVDNGVVNTCEHFEMSKIQQISNM